MAAPLSPQASADLTRQAWRMVRLQGMTQSQVAAHFKVDQSTISRHLRAYEEQQAAEYKEETELLRARETLILEHLIELGLVAYEKSTRDRERLRTAGNRRQRDRSGQLLELPDLQYREEIPGMGNPRFLAEVRRAVADLRKLWALDLPRQAPEKPPTPNPKSEIQNPKSEVPQLDRVIYQVNRLPGIYEEPERASEPAHQPGSEQRAAPARPEPGPAAVQSPIPNSNSVWTPPHHYALPAPFAGTPGCSIPSPSLAGRPGCISHSPSLSGRAGYPPGHPQQVGVGRGGRSPPGRNKARPRIMRDRASI